MDYPVRFKVTLATGQEVDVDPNAHLAIGPDLTEEMQRQPALFAYYAGLAEEEYRKGKRLKFRIHCLEEDLDARLRKEATKRFTERELKTRIKSHPKMRKLYDRYVATMRKAGHLKNIKDAFDQRYHLLQSIGARERAEMDTDLRTLKLKVKQKTNRSKQEE
jgi:hypothetical protein